MSDEREFVETSKVESTVRQVDADGRVVSVTTTTVVVAKPKAESEPPTGMYL